MERLGSFKSALFGNQPHAGPLLSITDHRRLVINAFMLSIAIFKRNFDELLLFRFGSVRAAKQKPIWEASVLLSQLDLRSLYGS